MRTLLLTASVAVLAMSCGSEPSEPVAGVLNVVLSTPRTDDGGILFTIEAPASVVIEGVTPACGGCQIFWRATGTHRVRAAVTGDVVSGPIARIMVSDTRRPTDFVMAIEEVATRTFMIVVPTGYGLTVD